MSKSDDTRVHGSRGASSRNGPLHGLILILSALERDVEIGIDGAYFRLFRAGDVVRLPAGYFRLEEDRILERLQGHKTGVSRAGEFIYVDNGTTLNGLMWRAQMLTEEAQSRIAASARSSQWQACGDTSQAGAGMQNQKSAQVLQLFGKNS